MPDKQPEPFYLTTPIYYVNARPHIGHAYTTIVADVLARRARSQSRPTFFLTGTDEHGQKIERSAAAAGIPPQQFTDEVSAAFSTLWRRMGITHDAFIRTTDPAHQRGVQHLFRTLYDNGQIYLSSYTGQYSIGEEMFIEGPPGTIGPDGKPTETVTEENFFFRLSEYQLPLLNLIESNELKITPDSRRNEVLSFLRGNPTQPGQEAVGAPGHAASSRDLGSQAHTALGAPYLPGALKDLSISRSSFTWGIPVPPDIQQAAGAKENHIIYVWLDALANYITALGYGSSDTTLFEKFWPADLHLVGKEIIRFHCVYWPAFLLAANLPLPKAITAHGWLLFEDSKMSKSKGNIVRTETILDAFGQLCPPPPPTTTEQTVLGIRSGLQPAESSSEKKGALAPGSPLPATNPGAPGLASETWASPQPQPPTPNSDASHKDDASDHAGALLKGTASAVPQTLPAQPGASAPEVRSPEPTPQDRDLFAADILRYFLLREIPFGQDGSFTFEALITRYNADLANGYGNLVSRTLNLIQQNFAGIIPYEFYEVIDPTSHKLALARGIGEVAKKQREQFVGGSPGDTRESYLAFILKLSTENTFDTYLFNVFSLVQKTDQLFALTTPWVLAKEKTDPTISSCLSLVLYTAAESIRIITALLHPILPHATANVWRQLGLGDIEKADLTNLTWGGLQPGTKLGPLSPIFPRADKKLAEVMTQMEQEKNAPTHANAAHDTTSTENTEFAETPIASKPPLSKLVDETTGRPAAHVASFDPAAGPRTSHLPEPNPGAQVAASAAITTERPATPSHTEAPASGIFAGEPADASPQITIDDFAKIELRVAQILVCERIPKADKLLRLEVDLGYEKRQILSGIAEWYTPEDLIGRRIVVITNLAPRKMRGLESHGMLLAASSEGGRPALTTFLDTDQLPLGSRLK